MLKFLNMGESTYSEYRLIPPSPSRSSSPAIAGQGNILENPPRRLTRLTIALVCLAAFSVLVRPMFETRGSGVLGQLGTLQRALANPPGPNLPNTCVIARTYGSHLPYSAWFLLSIYLSGLKNTRVFLLNTDKSMNIRQLEEGAKLVNFLVGKKDWAKFLDFPMTKTGDFGYELTDRTLEFLYSHHTIDCEYVLITNGDNLYSATMGSHLAKPISQHRTLIGFDFVSHHHLFGIPDKLVLETPSVNNSHTFQYSHSPETHQVLNVEFKTMMIDLGAALFHLPTLRKHSLTFWRTHPSGAGYGWESDGYFIEAVNKLSASTWIERSVLMLHQ